jgi:hypothetical protein
LAHAIDPWHDRIDKAVLCAARTWFGVAEVFGAYRNFIEVR